MFRNKLKPKKFDKKNCSVIANEHLDLGTSLLCAQTITPSITSTSYLNECKTWNQILAKFLEKDMCAVLSVPGKKTLMDKVYLNTNGFHQCISKIQRNSAKNNEWLPANNTSQT